MERLERQVLLLRLLVVVVVVAQLSFRFQRVALEVLGKLFLPIQAAAGLLTRPDTLSITDLATQAIAALSLPEA